MKYTIACLLFADDVTLMAPTRGTLQMLLNICAIYCSKFCLRFNVGKTKIMVFGKLSKFLPTIAKINLNGTDIDYVTNCRYLGFYIVAGVFFSISVDEDLRSFFGSVNAILTSVKQPKENILMQLLYSNCVPKLTYGAAVKDLTAAEKQRYNVAVNNAIRRIFRFRYWQSIRQIRHVYGFDSIEIMFAKAKTRFFKVLSVNGNCTLQFLSSVESYVVE